MSEVELTMKEQTKYEIVKRFVDNNCKNYKNLAIQLNLSLKTAYNLFKKYNEKDKSAFIHKNHNRKPATTKSEELCNQIITIFNKIERDINFKYF